MHSHFRPLLFSMILALVLPAFNLLAQGGQQSRRDASEEAPDALIGTWILNVAKSKYAGTPPKSLIRTFDYTRDGLILVTAHILNADGTRIFANWFVSMDGAWHPEFARAPFGTGAVPFMMNSMKRIDDYTLDWSAKRNGRITQTGSWSLSKDGKTLTQTVTSINAQGQKSTNIVVYDKQP